METYSSCNPFFLQQDETGPKYFVEYLLSTKLVDHLDIFRANGLLEATYTCTFIPCVLYLN